MNYDNLKVIPPTVAKMAEDSGLTVSRVAAVIPELTKDVLRTWHTKGENVFVDEKVESAWSNLFKYPYSSVSEDITPLYAKGPPGQGKTTAFKVVMKNISEAMGVDLYLDPDIDAEPNQFDIVGVVSQLGGALSPSIIQGVPTTENGVTVYQPPSRIKKMASQHFGMFILDDLDNANDHVKNATMPVVLDKRLNDVSLSDNCYVGITGNLGALDGTNTSRDSAALLNRSSVKLVCDTVGDWLERGTERYQDEYGMAYLDEFLIQNPDSFYPPVDKKYRGQRATSRSWDNLMDKLRNILADHDAQKLAGLTPLPLIAGFESTMSNYVGKSVGEELMCFYSDVLTLARPAAMEAMSKSRLSDVMRNKLKHEFTQNHTPSSESVARGYLRQMQKTLVSKLMPFVTMKPVESQEQLHISRSVTELIDRYVEGCFTTGLIKGNKQNLIAANVNQLVGDLVNATSRLPENDVTLNFGYLNEDKLAIPSEILVTLLTQRAAKYNANNKDGEALLNVTPDGDQVKTALETAFTDPLTYVAQSISAKNDLAKINMT